MDMDESLSFEIAERYMRDREDANLLDLPPEIWRYAAIFANYRDLMSLCATSSSLRREICDNNNFWKNKTYHDFDGLYPIDEETVSWRVLYENFRERRTREFLELTRLYPTAGRGWVVDERAFRILEDDFRRGILDLELRDIEGRTPLLQSILTSSPSIIRGLLELGANVNARDRENRTALMYTTELNRKFEIVNDLLRFGADVNARNSDGLTVLMIASEFGYPRKVKLFLDKGADPDVQTPFGTTALMLASENGKLDVVKILLENGADVYLRDDWGRVGKGRTALDWAKANGHKDIVELFLKYGAGGVLRKTALILEKMGGDRWFL